MDFPTFLKLRREAAGLSLQRLGEMSGISDTTIRKIENGDSPNLRWETVLKLTRALNISEADFLELAGYTPLFAQGATAIQNVEGLSDQELETVQSFIDFLHHRRSHVGEGGEIDAL